MKIACSVPLLEKVKLLEEAAKDHKLIARTWEGAQAEEVWGEAQAVERRDELRPCSWGEVIKFVVIMREAPKQRLTKRWIHSRAEFTIFDSEEEFEKYTWAVRV